MINLLLGIKVCCIHCGEELSALPDVAVMPLENHVLTIQVPLCEACFWEKHKKERMLENDE